MINGMVSIVIPIVRNDIYIKENIGHIEMSTYKNYEIIVVDEGKERSYQRNFGIKKAQGEYLLWLDSDMMIQPDMLEDCVKKMQDQEVVGVYIPERISTPGWFGRLRDWERQFYTGTLVDCARVVRLKDCPLFDETLHGVEDSDWERRLPKGKMAISESYFNHHDKIGLWKYLRKKAYYAKCLSAYKEKNPNDKLLTLKYRCFQIFVENGKWKRLLSRPDLAFQVALLLLARGLIMKWQTRHDS